MTGAKEVGKRKEDHYAVVTSEHTHTHTHTHTLTHTGEVLLPLEWKISCTGS
jgi:hypothetical protein